jgi:hypothetical protein
VAETGAPVERVPAYLVTDGGVVKLRVSARAREGLVEVVLEEVEEAGARAAAQRGGSDAA